MNFLDTFSVTVLATGQRASDGTLVPAQLLMKDGYRSQKVNKGKAYEALFTYKNGSPKLTGVFTITWLRNGSTPISQYTPSSAVEPPAPEVRYPPQRWNDGRVSGTMPDAAGSYTGTISANQP